jgi:hypothetical protein
MDHGPNRKSIAGLNGIVLVKHGQGGFSVLQLKLCMREQCPVRNTASLSHVVPACLHPLPTEM